MDNVDTVVMGDYGADYAEMSKTHIKQLAEKSIFVPLLQLNKPVRMELAVSGRIDPPIIVSNKKARVTTTLYEPEGPLKLRNVEYVVFKEKMPEVLLSRPILKALGFHLADNLLSLRENSMKLIVLTSDSR